MTDPIADMLTRIRNAQAVGQPSTEIPFSRVKFIIAKILVSKGFLKETKEIMKKGKGFIKVFLTYRQDKSPVISGLKRISRPGQRIYKKYKEIKMVKAGHGLMIISTPEGIMAGKEAKKRKLGGEVICQVW